MSWVSNVIPAASSLAVFKTRHSFHAVRAIDETVPNQRYGMQFQYYEPSGGLFKDLSVPDLMQVKQKAVPLIQRAARKLRIAS